jgi:hypothetical protein
MRNMHVWDHILAVQVPNLLPKTVPWFGKVHGHWEWHSSHFPRKGGRLIWATILFTIGLVIAFVWVRRPKKSVEPATWAQTFLGAFLVWVMLTLGYGVIPSEWIIFGNSYLNFDSSTFLLHKNNFIHFDITRDKITDAVAAGIYVVVLVLNVYLFVAWQKRKVAEPVTEEEAPAPEPEATGGPFARLRRRDKRVSAYGRPVTTSE